MGELSIPENYEELAELISSQVLSGQEILEIAQAHVHDEIWDCAVCGDEDALESVVELLIDNQSENMNAESLTFLYDNIHSWLQPADGGLLEFLSVHELALHPLSEPRLLEEAAQRYVVHTQQAISHGDEVTRQDHLSILFEVAEHPNSSAAVIQKWVEEIHAEAYLCDEISFADCDECRAMLEGVSSSASSNSNASNSINQPSRKVGLLTRIFGVKKKR
jgi:hypothetical protein